MLMVTPGLPSLQITLARIKMAWIVSEELLTYRLARLKHSNEQATNTREDRASW